MKTFMHIDNLANTFLQTTSNSVEIKYFILKYFVRINLLADYNLWRGLVLNYSMRGGVVGRIETLYLPISSKRSTQTTNAFVSGPSWGKDFPVDDLFAFTKGLS